MLLAEEVVVLALDVNKGKIPFSKTTLVDYGISGAILTELVIMNRIDIESGIIKIVDSSPLKIPILDNVLKLMNETKTEKSLQYWLKSLIRSSKSLEKEIFRNLEKSKFLKIKKKKVLGIFPIIRYEITNIEKKNEVLSTLKEIVLEGKETDECSTFLLGVTRNCAQIKDYFPEDRKNDIIKRIDELAKNQIVCKAIQELIKAQQQAFILTNVTMPY